jgi:hypothetical protein
METEPRLDPAKQQDEDAAAEKKLSEDVEWVEWEDEK